PMSSVEGYMTLVNFAALYQIYAEQIGVPLSEEEIQALPYIFILHVLREAVRVREFGDFNQRKFDLDRPFHEMQFFVDFMNLDLQKFSVQLRDRMRVIQKESS